MHTDYSSNRKFVVTKHDQAMLAYWLGAAVEAHA
jgi:hypothetical protein